MSGEWRSVGVALVLAFGVAVVPLQAQRGQGVRGQGAQGQGGPNMGHSLELALNHQEDLGLSEGQVTQLEELKAVMDRDVVGLGEEMKALREGIRAGDVDRDEGFRQMEALRGKLITNSAPLRGRIQEILTVEQHNKLQPLARQDRTGVGRAGVGQGRAFQGQGRALQGQGRALQGQGRAFQGQGRAFQGKGAPRGLRDGRGMGRVGQARGVRRAVGVRSRPIGPGLAPAAAVLRSRPGSQYRRGIGLDPSFRQGSEDGAPEVVGGEERLP